MQFLWSLLPGAREARNQVLIGYAWLAALALWIGVPSVPDHGHVHELVEAIGSVGTGIAVSFAAFMIGSLFDDLTAPLFGWRRAMAFTSGVEGGLEVLDRMGEVGRSELGRLEGSIDRESAELGLRFGLLLPLVVSAVAVQRSGFEFWWLLGFAGVAAALGFQIVARRDSLLRDLRSSNLIRAQVDRELAFERANAATKELATHIEVVGEDAEAVSLREMAEYLGERAAQAERRFEQATRPGRLFR
jgi:hypothetical protein